MALNSSKLIVTLRHNIDIESDIDLAILELTALCHQKESQRIATISSISELHNLLCTSGVDEQSIRLLSHCVRKKGTLALMVEGVTQEHFEQVIRAGAFGQDAIFITSARLSASKGIIKKLTRACILNNKKILRGITLSSVLDYSTRMVFNRDKGLSVAVGLDALVDYLLDGSESANGMMTAINDAITAKKTTLYLTHELHLYKGKFFPRMVRSLINLYAKKSNSIIVDPFAGSGTALLEASLLGYDSYGIDVDPTSVLISQQKLTPKDIDPALMQDICACIYDAVYGSTNLSLFSKTKYAIDDWRKFRISAPEPMRSRLIKRGNEEGYDLLDEIESDSAKVLCLISQTPEDMKPLMRVCLSHALTKKLRLRFVGIGNGRFTIDVARVRVLDLFVKKCFHLVAITEVFAWLRRNGISFSGSSVIRGSAKDFDHLMEGRKVDLVLTSPPYIPASSGREHYARARAIPLVFTGAATVEELDHLDEAFIGEMSAQQDTLHLEQDMPPTIRKTLEFLRSDEQRRPKYLPTLNYYVDLQRVLTNTKNCLSDSGKALFVVGTSHTFYIHKTKQIVHTVDAVRGIAELGAKVGLQVDTIINIPLKKSGGLNARPRSTDDYSESVVVFSKAIEKPEYHSLRYLPEHNPVPAGH